MRLLARGLLHVVATFGIGVAVWVVINGLLLLALTAGTSSCIDPADCDDAFGMTLLWAMGVFCTFCIMVIAVIVYNLHQGLLAWRRLRSCRIRQVPTVVPDTHPTTEEPDDDRRPPPRLPAPLRRGGP